MKTVRFLETRTVQCAGGPTYEKGSVHTLRDDQVRHWVNRGIVELIDAPPPEVVVEPKEDESLPVSSIRPPWEKSSGDALDGTEEPDGENTSNPG